MQLEELFNKVHITSVEGFLARACYWIRQQPPERLPEAIRTIREWEEESARQVVQFERFLGAMAAYGSLNIEALEMLWTEDPERIATLLGNPSVEGEKLSWMQAQAVKWLVDNPNRSGEPMSKAKETLDCLIQQGHPLEPDIRRQLIEEYFTQTDGPGFLLRSLLASPALTTEELRQLIPHIERHQKQHLAYLLITHPNADQEAAGQVLQRFAPPKGEGYWTELLAAVVTGRKGRNNHQLHEIMIDKTDKGVVLQNLLEYGQLRGSLPRRALKRWAKLDPQKLTEQLQQRPEWLKAFNKEDFIPLLASSHPELRQIAGRLAGRQPSTTPQRESQQLKR